MVVNGRHPSGAPPDRKVGMVGDDPTLFWYPDTGYIRAGRAKPGSGDIQYGGTYPAGSPMGNIPAPGGTTPWGVQVGTGERAIAPPGSEKYAGQEYIGGVGLTGGGFTGAQTGAAGQPYGRYYQTPEDKFTELQTKLGLNQPEVKPWLIPPSAGYEGLPNPAYAGRAGNVLPGQQGATPKYTMMPRQGETTTVPRGGGGQGEVPPPEERMTYEQARYAASLFGGTVAGDDLNGYYVVPPRVTMGPATVRLPETNWEKTQASLFSPTMPPDFWRTGREGELQRAFPIQAPGVPLQTPGVSPVTPMGGSRQGGVPPPVARDDLTGYDVVPSRVTMGPTAPGLPTGSEIQAGAKLPTGYQMISPPPPASAAKKSPEQEAFDAMQKMYVTQPETKAAGTAPTTGVEVYTDTDGQRYFVYRDVVGNVVRTVPITPQIAIDELNIAKAKLAQQVETSQREYELAKQKLDLQKQAEKEAAELARQQFEERKRATATGEVAARGESERARAQQEYQNQLAIMQMMQQRQQLMSQTNLQYQMQQQALGAQREQRLAELAANPSSWLEYAALSGQPAKVQPWMLPLGYSQYGFQIGQEIPGTAGAGSFAGLPELTTPSAQYAARMLPSQRQQYRGYQRAKKGLTPADTEFYLWNMVPGGGGIRGLSYQR